MHPYSVCQSNNYNFVVPKIYRVIFRAVTDSQFLIKNKNKAKLTYIPVFKIHILLHCGSMKVCLLSLWFHSTMPGT